MKRGVESAPTDAAWDAARITRASSELWRLPATELAQLVRLRKVSAREAAADALKRLDEVNPRINAVVAHRPEQVLAQADELDRRIGRGEDVGPLAGVPVTVKINVDMAGWACSAWWSVRWMMIGGRWSLERESPDQRGDSGCRSPRV